MYKKVNNKKLLKELKESTLFEMLDFEDMFLEVYARYTKDDCSDKSYFCNYNSVNVNSDIFDLPIKQFMSLLKNHKHHLDPTCEDGLGLDITKNVEIMIDVTCEYEGSQGTFILII